MLAKTAYRSQLPAFPPPSPHPTTTNLSTLWACAPWIRDCSPEMSAIVWLAALVAAYFVWSGFQQKQRRLSLPPGPKGLPLIGNL